MLSCEDFHFMLNLLHNHPQRERKIGSGIVGIYILQNPVYKNQRTFILRRYDGTETDFSWMECITPSSHCKKVRSAFRAIVAPSIIQFKKNFFAKLMGSSVCELTKVPITFSTSHVDHKPPNTFEQLLSDFLASQNLIMEEICLKDGFKDNVYTEELENRDVASSWQNYHHKYANLRVIHAKANLGIRRNTN